MTEPVWTPHTVTVWETWTHGRYTAFKYNFCGPWHLSDDGGTTSRFTAASLQEVMDHVHIIEAHLTKTQEHRDGE